MFAYLVDRTGAMCSTDEIMAVIFEDDGSHKSYYHRIRSDLIDSLEAIDCKEVIMQQKGMLGISIANVDCDYYDYLNGKVSLARAYHGEYMAQYSFAEVTNAELFAKTQKNT